MMRAILWKEYREQRLPTLILTALGLLVMGVSLPMFESRPDPVMHFGMAALFAWACGMVTGAILLANEQESHTQPFLDALPKWRSQVWRAKLVYGGIITLIQVLLFSALCLLLPAEGANHSWVASYSYAKVLADIFPLTALNL